MKYIKALAVCAAFLSALSAAPVSANVLAQVGGSAGLNADLEGGVNAGVDANAGINARSDNPSAANKASSSASNASSAARAHASAQSAVKATASSTGNLFVITRGDVAATTTGSVTAANVSSANDLSLYARSLIMSDSHVSKVETADDRVSVWYDEPAKFLGIVPVTVTVRSTVDAEGNVTLGYPWWYGLFVKDDNQAEFQADLSNTAGTIARGEATTTLSSAAKARLVNAIQSIMKNRYDTTSGTTSAETKTY